MVSDMLYRESLEVYTLDFSRSITDPWRSILFSLAKLVSLLLKGGVVPFLEVKGRSGLDMRVLVSTSGL